MQQKDYSFYPRTWVLPNDASDFRAQFDGDGKSRQVFIIKPDNSSKVRKEVALPRVALWPLRPGLEVGTILGSPHLHHAPKTLVCLWSPLICFESPA